MLPGSPGNPPHKHVHTFQEVHSFFPKEEPPLQNQNENSLSSMWASFLFRVLPAEVFTGLTRNRHRSGQTERRTVKAGLRAGSWWRVWASLPEATAQRHGLSCPQGPAGCGDETRVWGRVCGSLDGRRPSQVGRLCSALTNFA